MCFSSDRFQDKPDGRREALPIGFLRLEIFLSGACEGIIFCAAIVFGFAPFGLNPGLLFEAMQSGVEGALIDLEDIVGDAANALGNGPSVHGFEGNGLKDEKVESALDEVRGFGHEASP